MVVCQLRHWNMGQCIHPSSCSTSLYTIISTYRALFRWKNKRVEYRHPSIFSPSKMPKIKPWQQSLNHSPHHSISLSNERRQRCSLWAMSSGLTRTKRNLPRPRCITRTQSLSRNLTNQRKTIILVHEKQTPKSLTLAYILLPCWGPTLVTSFLICYINATMDLQRCSKFWDKAFFFTQVYMLLNFEMHFKFILKC
jgi:hypothetical protein